MYRPIDTMRIVSAPLALAIVLAVAIPVALWRAYRRDDSLVERWALDRSLELTPDNRRLVARYLRNARVLRTWGAIAGAILPSLIELAVSGRIQVLGFGTDGDSAPLGFGTIFLGYLVGALCAEVSLARPKPGLRRSASLVRRELGDYLPHAAVLAQRAATAAGALGLLVMALVPYPEDVSNPSPLVLTLAAAGLVAFGIALEAIERWLVRRPQPFTSQPVVAADNAIRSQSISVVAGAGLALLLLFCSGVALGLQASDVAVLRTAMIVPAVACLLAALAVCQGVGDGSGRVRRSAETPRAASA
jgi:hypothetical protein